MQQGGISVAALYCNRCGCENSSDRSACVRCLNALAWPAEGNTCANCGGDNSSNASYCFNCGEPLGDVEAAADWSLNAAINLALGGEAELDAADVEDEEDFIGDDAPSDVPELDFDEPAAEDLALPDDAEEPEMFEEVETLDLADESAEDSEFAPQIPEDAAPEVDQVALEELAIELGPDLDAPVDEAAVLEEPAEESFAEFAAPEPVESAEPGEPVEEVADGESEEGPAASDEADGDEDDSVFGGWALELDEE